MNDKELYIQQLKQELKALQTKVSSLETNTEVKQPNPSVQKANLAFSEHPPYDFIFNEAELFTNDMAVEPTTVDIRSYLQTVSAKTDDAMTPEAEQKEYNMDEEELFCRHCGTKKLSAGYETARTEVDFIPGRLKVRNFIRTIYICPKCKAEGHSIIKRASIPSPVIKKSLASPAAIAHTICTKYLYNTSLTKQEQIWKEYHTFISKETLANWIIHTANQWLLPFFEYLKKELLGRTALFTSHMAIPVVKDKNKPFSSQVCIWVFRTDFPDKKPLILFDCTLLKNGCTPKKFLRGYKGFLHINGYKGYEQVKATPLCVSWLYVKTLFEDAVNSSNESTTADAAIGFKYCKEITDFEKTLEGKSPSQRTSLRNTNILPVIEDFFKWLTVSSPLKYSKLEKAMQYALSQRNNLTRYLNDGCCSVSNEAAIESLLPFIPQKQGSWEFCDYSSYEKVPNRESISIYSLIETAKANKLDVFQYFVYLLEGLPSENFRKDLDVLQKYMPWHEAVQARCSLKHPPS